MSKTLRSRSHLNFPAPPCLPRCLTTPVVLLPYHPVVLSPYYPVVLLPYHPADHCLGFLSCPHIMPALSLGRLTRSSHRWPTYHRNNLISLYYTNLSNRQSSISP